MRSELASVGAAVLLLTSACGGEDFSSTGSGGSAGSSGGSGGAATGGASGAGGGSAGTTGDTGCADGSRESFKNKGTFPDIAGCSGGWSVPGLGADSAAPKCGRQGGNDGPNPNGDGCGVEDLCASGWHVCKSAQDVSAHGVTSNCVATGNDGLWITRQSQDQNGACSPPPAANNIVGCGSLGAPSPGNCSPLNRHMKYTDCNSNPPWNCGDQSSSTTEAHVVTKGGPQGGGVLCCRTK